MNYSNETSEDKQGRLHCTICIGINNWDCYRDCTFWNGKKCTNYEHKKKINIGVIGHVEHGKSTLIEALFKKLEGQ